MLLGPLLRAMPSVSGCLRMLCKAFLYAVPCSHYSQTRTATHLGGPRSWLQPDWERWGKAWRIRTEITPDSNWWELMCISRSPDNDLFVPHDQDGGGRLMAAECEKRGICFYFHLWRIATRPSRSPYDGGKGLKRHKRIKESGGFAGSARVFDSGRKLKAERTTSAIWGDVEKTVGCSSVKEGNTRCLNRTFLLSHITGQLQASFRCVFFFLSIFPFPLISIFLTWKSWSVAFVFQIGIMQYLWKGCCMYFSHSERQ